MWLIRDVIDPMIKKNAGHIVSINSIAGLAGNPGMVDYCASKFAAYGLNEALRLEMKSLGHKIKFTTVCPFAFNSGMFKGVQCSLLYPLLEMEDVANRTVNAILQEEAEVGIPWSLGFFAHFCKAIFPPDVCDFLTWLLVGYESILTKKFQGREGDKNALNVVVNKKNKSNGK